MVFEAMTIAVNGLQVSKDQFGIHQTSVAILGARPGDNKLRTLNTLTHFREEMPLTAEVIVAASRRFVGNSLTDYALLGAALERRIALATMTMDYGKS